MIGPLRDALVTVSVAPVMLVACAVMVFAPVARPVTRPTIWPLLAENALVTLAPLAVTLRPLNDPPADMEIATSASPSLIRSARLLGVVMARLPIVVPPPPPPPLPPPPPPPQEAAKRMARAPAARPRRLAFTR